MDDRSSLTLREMLSPRARREWSLLRQLDSWLGAHGGLRGLADRLDRPVGSIAPPLRGSRPSRPVIEEVAALLGVTPDELEAAIQERREGVRAMSVDVRRFGGEPEGDYSYPSPSERDRAFARAPRGSGSLCHRGGSLH